MLCGAFSLLVASFSLPLFAVPQAGAAVPGTTNLFPVRDSAKKAVRASKSGSLGMQAFIGLASQLGPAVVNIVCTRLPQQDEDNLRPSGGSRQQGREQGAGVLINPQGYILTNNHVVEQAADIRVRLHDEQELPAQLVGRDERTDMALIKIDAGSAPLPWAPLGNSDQVHIGEWVMAIGSPFGLDHTVTVGIVSAKGRRDVQPGSQPGFFDFLQTDAPINPGNSGGPLINVRGEVIGINSAVNVTGSGIGFAIPSNIARVIAEQLHSRGQVLRSWLGVYPQPLTESLRRAFRLPDRHGALLAEVYAPSPAQQAGLQAGDVIIEFDGRKVERADDLMWYLGIAEERPAAVRYYRAGVLQQGTVMLRPESSRAPEAAKPARKPSSIGIAVAELTPQLAQKMGFDKDDGLVILSVESGSPAMDAGAERGDIILRINDDPVKSLNDYVSSINRVKSGEILRLLVRREAKKQWHNFWIAFMRR